MNIKWPLRTKIIIKKNCEDENIRFNFLGIKIKICCIYKDEKLI